MRRFLLIVAAAVLGAAAFAQSAAAVAADQRGLQLQRCYGRPDRRLFVSGHRRVHVAQAQRPTSSIGTAISRGFKVHQRRAGRLHGERKNTRRCFPTPSTSRCSSTRRRGEVTHVFASGIVSRVPLPGGDFFLTAGRAGLRRPSGCRRSLFSPTSDCKETSPDSARRYRHSSHLQRRGRERRPGPLARSYDARANAFGVMAYAATSSRVRSMRRSTETSVLMSAARGTRALAARRRRTPRRTPPACGRRSCAAHRRT